MNLINQSGREKKIGDELDRIVQQANLSYVRYNRSFDFFGWSRVYLNKKRRKCDISTKWCLLYYRGQFLWFLTHLAVQVQPVRLPQGVSSNAVAQAVNAERSAAS